MFHKARYVPEDVRKRSRFDPKRGCWLWLGRPDPDGYGMIKVQGVSMLAHRFSWMVYNGPIPEGMTIDHLCRVRSCVNPKHLECVTLQENILRGESPAAKRARQATCIRGHPLIRRTDGRGRFCPICRDMDRSEKEEPRI